MNPISPTVQKIIDKLDNVRQSGDKFTARCPAHEDKQNSLSVGQGNDDRALLKCFAGCDAPDIVAAMGLKMKDLFPPKSTHPSNHNNSESKSSDPSAASATTQPSGCTVAQFSERKQLKEFLLGPVGIVDQVVHGTPVVRIPYLGVDRTEVAVRYRTALDKTDHEDNRFRWKSGSKTTLYGLWRMGNGRQDGYTLLLEGETDTLTAWQYGLPAVGIPGANNWKEEWVQYFEDIPIIYVFIEPDKGGQAVLKWLANSELRHRAKIVQLEEAKDLNELHCLDPNLFLERLRKALETAPTWDKFNKTAEKERRAKAWKNCSELAKKDDILKIFAASLNSSGVVGVRRAAKLIYLCVTSRVLSRPARPVSAAVKALSSAGKSFLVESTLKYFPESASYILTAMSERALAYDDEPLKHRMLVIVEAAGLKGDTANLLVRSLLSEGMVRYKTVEKTQGGLKPRLIEREGPTGLIVTTTDLHLHKENETRLFSVTINDTPEQTSKIMMALASEQHNKLDYSEWHALQEWIAYGDTEVTIPYAEKLASAIPPVAVRLRRDFGAILNLIRTHALLHQMSRKKSESGKVVATLHDYEVVRELVIDVVSEGLEVTVSKHIRETVEAVNALKAAGSDERLTYAAVAKKLKVDKSTLKRRADAAIEAGYLRNDALKGRPANLEIGDPMPEEQDVLPTVEKLRDSSDLTDKAKLENQKAAHQPTNPIPPAPLYPGFPKYGLPHQREIQAIQGAERCVHCGVFVHQQCNQSGNQLH